MSSIGARQDLLGHMSSGERSLRCGGEDAAEIFIEVQP